ncbi:MAG: MerR family transcriptional regulator [Deltaproteobacteria bacterium]|nr:MerR family transcriptional regulator [Deltaproteobacteria bacterium]
MTLLSQVELRRVERQHPQGVSSAVIVDAFKSRRQRFSEATLRKYVQLGLLPTSRRVGSRGRNRGSRGLYPVVVVRLVNEIKRALDRGGTLEEIRRGSVGLSGELVAVERAWAQLWRRFEDAVAHVPAGKQQRAVRKRLSQSRRIIEREVRALDRVAVRLGQLTDRRMT